MYKVKLRLTLFDKEPVARVTGFEFEPIEEGAEAIHEGNHSAYFTSRLPVQNTEGEVDRVQLKHFGKQRNGGYMLTHMNYAIRPLSLSEFQDGRMVGAYTGGYYRLMLEFNDDHEFDRLTFNSMVSDGLTLEQIINKTISANGPKYNGNERH